ncbi:MAG TPA: DUF554 family protein [Candidatus Eisenbacteria bacterium]|jgi:uncharacterized membrane protein YqgA involved in biofilm formation|nr:DUF554 family protein [Candidatus Eisenbacteria bacterium]
MIGTIVNVAGITAGGVIGLTRKKPLPPQTESFFKAALGAFTVFYGLRLTWMSLNGSGLHVLKQLLIAILAMMLGKLIGHLLGLQKLSNQLGQIARESIVHANPASPTRASEGFKTCTALFCAAPLGILGAIQDGLSGYFYPLAIKGVMEALATLGFISLFGWSVMLAALPVLAFQGTITLLCAQFLKPYLQTHGPIGMIDSINAVGGLLVFSVALVILGLKRIELADYLPGLVIAPLITWVWH